MAHQTSLADALRAESLEVVEHPGWQARGSTAFDPQGVICHHTGPGAAKPLVDLCIRGRADLPGPLAQVVLTPDGVAHVIAAGRANHAGPGKWNGVKGNSRLFGIEAVHCGNADVPWPEKQIQAYHRVVAAMCRVAHVGADMVAAHREYALPAGRKPDPCGLDMDAFRAAVAQILGSVEKPQKVKEPPMFDPPIVLEPIVAELASPTGGTYLLAGSGAIYAFGGAQYTGGANNKNYFKGRRAARLEFAPDNRPIIVATSGERYGPDFSETT